MEEVDDEGVIVLQARGSQPAPASTPSPPPEVATMEDTVEALTQLTLEQAAARQAQEDAMAAEAAQQHRNVQAELHQRWLRQQAMMQEHLEAEAISTAMAATPSASQVPVSSVRWLFAATTAATIATMKASPTRTMPRPPTPST